MRQRFEHKIIECEGSEISSVLSEEELEGWELITCMRYAKGMYPDRDQFRLFFKRPVEIMEHV